MVSWDGNQQDCDCKLSGQCTETGGSCWNLGCSGTDCPTTSYTCCGDDQPDEPSVDGEHAIVCDDNYVGSTGICERSIDDYACCKSYYDCVYEGVCYKPGDMVEEWDCGTTVDGKWQDITQPAAVINSITSSQFYTSPSGTKYTGTQAITLAVYANDGGSGLYGCKIYENIVPPFWDIVNCSGTRSLSLTSWDGLKSVTFQARDNVGNTGSDIDSVYLDQTAPGAPTRNPAARDWANTDAVVTVTYTDSLSGVPSTGNTFYCWTGGTTCMPSTPFTNGGTITQSFTGNWTLCTKAADNVGNVAAFYDCSFQGVYKVDKTAPVYVGATVSNCAYLNLNNCWVRGVTPPAPTIFNVEITHRDDHSSPLTQWLSFTKNACTPNLCIPGDEIKAYYNVDTSARTDVFVNDNYLDITASSCMILSGCGAENGNVIVRWDVQTGPAEGDFAVWTYLYDEAINGVGYTQLSSAAGNWLVRIDNTLPTGTISINVDGVRVVQVGSNKYTNETTGITAQTSSSDSRSGIKECAHGWNAPASGWDITYCNNGAVSLAAIPAGDGTKTIRFYARDNAGNPVIANPGDYIATDAVILDQTPPGTPTRVPAIRDWANTDAAVTVTYGDGTGSGVQYTRHCWTLAATCEPGTDPSSTFTNGGSVTQTSTGNWTLCTRARDNAGNWKAAECSAQGAYKVDKTAPVYVTTTRSGCAYEPDLATCWVRAGTKFNFEVTHRDDHSSPLTNYLTFTLNACTPNSCPGGCSVGTPIGTTCPDEIKSYVNVDTGAFTDWMLNNNYLDVTSAACTQPGGCGGEIATAKVLWNITAGSTEGDFAIWTFLYDEASNGVGYTRLIPVNTWQVRIDSTLPTGSVQFSGPNVVTYVDGTKYAKSTSLQITTTASDSRSGTSSCAYKINNSLWTSVACSTFPTVTTVTLPSSTEGMYFVYFNITDNVGNVRQITDNVTLDRTGPILNLELGCGYDTTAGDLKAAGRDYCSPESNSKYTVYAKLGRLEPLGECNISWTTVLGQRLWDTQIIDMFTGSPNPNAQFTMSNFTGYTAGGYSGHYDVISEGEGNKTVWYNCTDFVGNPSAAGSKDWIVIDKTPPSATLTQPTVPFIDASSINVVWTGSDPPLAGVTGSTLDCYSVQYRTTGGPWRSWLSCTTATSGQFGLGGIPVALADGNEYCFRVNATDRAGNTGVWSPVTCIVVDRQGPVVDHVNDTDGTSNIDIDSTPSVVRVGSVWYITDTGSPINYTEYRLMDESTGAIMSAKNLTAVSFPDPTPPGNFSYGNILLVSPINMTRLDSTHSYRFYVRANDSLGHWGLWVSSDGFGINMCGGQNCGAYCDGGICNGAGGCYAGGCMLNCTTPAVGVYDERSWKSLQGTLGCSRVNLTRCGPGTVCTESLQNLTCCTAGTASNPAGCGSTGSTSISGGWTTYIPPADAYYGPNRRFTIAVNNIVATAGASIFTPLLECVVRRNATSTLYFDKWGTGNAVFGDDYNPQPGSDGQWNITGCYLRTDFTDNGGWGLASNTTVYSFKVDTTPPNSSLTEPADNQIVGPRFTTRWTGSDPIVNGVSSGFSSYGLQYVDPGYYAGCIITPGRLPAECWEYNSTTTGTSLNIDLSTKANGTTTCFRIMATDKAGNTGNWSCEPGYSQDFSGCTCVTLDKEWPSDSQTSVKPAPKYTSTNPSVFSVNWSAVDYGAGMKCYEVSYRIINNRTGSMVLDWTQWNQVNDLLNMPVYNGAFFSVNCTTMRDSSFRIANVNPPIGDRETRTYYFRVRAVDNASGTSNIGPYIYSENGTWIDWTRPYVVVYAKRADGTVIGDGDEIRDDENVVFNVTGDLAGIDYTGVNSSRVFYSVITSDTGNPVTSGTLPCTPGTSGCEFAPRNFGQGDFNATYQGFSIDRAGNQGSSVLKTILIRQIFGIYMAGDVYLILGSYQHMPVRVVNRQEVNEEISIRILNDYRYSKFVETSDGELSLDKRTLNITMLPGETKVVDVLVYTADIGSFNMTIYANSTIPGHEKVNDAAKIRIGVVFPAEFSELSWAAVVILFVASVLIYSRYGTRD